MENPAIAEGGSCARRFSGPRARDIRTAFPPGKANCKTLSETETQSPETPSAETLRQDVWPGRALLPASISGSSIRRWAASLQRQQAAPRRPAMHPLQNAGPRGKTLRPARRSTGEKQSEIRAEVVASIHGPAVARVSSFVA